MATGEVADLDAIAGAAAEHEVMTVVDATQGRLAGARSGRFDVVAAHGYKWLMSPRGTAYMTIRPGILETVPRTAGWYGRGPARHPSGLLSARREREGSTRHRPGSCGWRPPGARHNRADRCRRDSRSRRGLAKPLSSRSRREARGLRHRHVDVPGAADKLERAGIQAAVRGERLGRLGTSTTPTRTWIERSTCSQADGQASRRSSSQVQS